MRPAAFFVILLLMVALTPLDVRTATGANDEYVDGELLVRFAPGAPGAAVAAAHRANNASVLQSYAPLDLDLVRVPPGQEQGAKAVYERNPNVLYAELNYIRSIPEPQSHAEGSEVLPGDYYFDEQWALHNTGQEFYCIPFLGSELCFYIGTADADIDYPEALAVTTGSAAVTIAVLDTGVDYTHPDLAANYGGGKDFVNDDDDPQDDHGHGTHVTGTAAAAVNNLTGAPGEEEGIAGVAPNATFIAGKICDASGMCPDDAIVDGILWAAGCETDPEEACGPLRGDVISMSIGGPTPSQAVDDAVQFAWNAGATIVAAAGNEGSTAESYPAAYPNVLSVGASDEDGLRAPFSNYSSWVDVSAPGNVILATWPMAGCAGAPQTPGDFGCYNYLSGTSMSTPHVAGVAAMVLSRADVTTNVQAVDIITQSADPDGVSSVPLNSWTAYGGVNLHDALSFGASVSPAPSVTIDQAAGQTDPTSASPINFTVTFSEAVTGFDAAGVTLGGTAPGTLAAVVSGGGPTYDVAVSGMTGDGTVTASIAAGAANAADDGLANQASTSTDNEVTYDGTAPAVSINQAGGQADPANAAPINFSVVFSEAVTGFDGGDVGLSGMAGLAATVSGGGASYNVAVTGMAGAGTVTASIAAGVATDGAGNGNAASTSADNTVAYDGVAPAASITAAAGQADPTSESPIDFTVVFSEPVSGFSGGDVSLGGTAGATTAVVTGSGTTYNVAVSGMTGSGSVTASVISGGAADAAGNGNTASGDTSVTYESPIAVLTITGISPASHAVCNCAFTVTVTGTGFVPGVSLSFSGGSGPSPAVSNIVVAPDGNSLTATMTLRSGGPRRPRVWDVQATNPDASTDVLAGGFTVTP